MRAPLRALLEHSIDYAGLFPPAKLAMEPALNEYLDLSTGQDSWIVDRFVCPALQLEDLTARLHRSGKSGVRVAVVGTKAETGHAESVRHDADAIRRAQASGAVSVEGYEVWIPQGSGLKSAVSACKRLPDLVEDSGVEVYLEVGWGDEMVEAMHEASSLFEGVGFKARTGGLTCDAFPSVEELASFISECAALECPFKYTAGLHQPLRYFDKELGCERHGFLNALLAGAAAIASDASRREIAEILDVTDPDQLHVGADDIRMADQWIESDGIEEFWDFFGGFGSCSVIEPIEGLRCLGLLEEVKA